MVAQSRKDTRVGKKSASRRKRSYNTRLIKATWPYTVQEIAKLFNVHKGAVLRWIKEGLHADKVRNEYLIRGNELVRFLSARQQKKRHKCGMNEFFCFKCRVARRAYLDIADVVIVSPSRFRLKGLCEVCRTSVYKAQGIRNLPKIQKCFHIQQVEGQHIIDRIDPIVNSNMEAHI